MRRIGRLRAVGWLCLVVACGKPGEDTNGEGTSSGGPTAATDEGSTAGDGTVGASETGASTTSTSGVSTTGEPTPTTGGGTGDESECDPRAQDCPEGLKCTSYGKLAGDAWNANKCVPEPADGGAVGDSCVVMGADMFTGIDNCARGSICLNTDPDLTHGFCVEFCSPEDGCPETQGGDGVCFPANEGALPICLFTCDPLLQDCIGKGGCYGDPGGPPFVCFNPDPKDGGMDGDPCGFANACLPGLSCTDAATQEGCTSDQGGCCSPFCALDEMTCEGKEECVPFFMAEQPGFENVGVCALPG